MDVKLIFENWRSFLKEKTFADLNVPKNKWIDIPVGILKNDPKNKDITDELYDLISKPYSSIGGHVDFKSPADIPGNHHFWSAINLDSEPEPDALRVSKKSNFGKKLTAGGSDGTPNAKKAYLDKTANLLNTPGNYGELSDAIAHIMITKYKAPYISNPKIVQSILGKDKPLKWVGSHPEGKYPGYDGWYIRNIGGKDHMKIMMGSPSV